MRISKTSGNTSNPPLDLVPINVRITIKLPIAISSLYLKSCSATNKPSPITITAMRYAASVLGYCNAEAILPSATAYFNSIILLALNNPVNAMTVPLRNNVFSKIRVLPLDAKYETKIKTKK